MLAISDIADTHLGCSAFLIAGAVLFLCALGKSGDKVLHRAETQNRTNTCLCGTCVW